MRKPRIVIFSAKNSLAELLMQTERFSVNHCEDLNQSMDFANIDLIIFEFSARLEEKLQLVINERQYHHFALILILDKNPILDELFLQDEAIKYLSKPIKLKSLFAITEQILNDKNSGNAIQLNERLFFCYDKKLISDIVNGNDIHLTEKETSIIRYLYEIGDNKASKQELLKVVWGYNELIETHTLETHIYRLRQKLEVVGELLLTDEDGYKLKL